VGGWGRGGDRYIAGLQGFLPPIERVAGLQGFILLGKDCWSPGFPSIWGELPASRISLAWGGLPVPRVSFCLGRVAGLQGFHPPGREGSRFPGLPSA
jgi:hypothetical protein